MIWTGTTNTIVALAVVSVLYGVSLQAVIVAFVIGGAAGVISLFVSRRTGIDASRAATVESVAATPTDFLPEEIVPEPAPVRDSFPAEVQTDTRLSEKLVREIDRSNGKLTEKLESVTQTIMSISERTNDLRESIEGQNSGLTEIAASVEEMAQNVRLVHKNTDQAAGASDTMQGAVTRSAEVMASATKHMQRLLESVETVRRFTASIGDIAERTKLLSINASIEAAHSGHEGKGFAVIAGEIRKLAANSATEADDAERALSAVISDIDQTAVFIERTQKIIEELGTSAREVDGIVRQIRGAMSEQEVGTNEIVTAVTQLSDSATGVTTDSGEIDSSIEEVQFSFIEMTNLAKNTQGNVRKVGAVVRRVQKRLEEIASKTYSMSA
jgi:methyl-accepting chemotaxis protein